MTECLSKLSNPPITTQTRILMLDKMSYPAVTMCFKNSDDQGYDEEILHVSEEGPGRDGRFFMGRHKKGACMYSRLKSGCTAV